MKPLLDVQELGSHLDDLFQQSSKVFTGRAPPYYVLATRDDIPNMSSTKIESLHDLLGRNTGSWPLFCGTVFQRPLYLGQTENLASRIEEHLRDDSPLQEYLAEQEIDVMECALIYVPLPEDYDKLPTSVQRDSLLVAEALMTRMARPLLNRKLE